MAFDVSAAVHYAFIHARPHSTGHCAKYIRRALERGGVHVISTRAAKDYGPALEAAGFHEVADTPDVTEPPQAGDVIVIQGVKGHPYGHMAMFNGRIWISDFKQHPWHHRGFYPGPAYRAAQAPFRIYRYA